ncbi:MAG: BamA/TamA family outer membrane protein [Rhodobacteraceae bacterium]|nr:BamA/TamA family outer membrane protein [Paracoccaceae bacterium]
MRSIQAALTLGVRVVILCLAGAMAQAADMTLDAGDAPEALQAQLLAAASVAAVAADPEARATDLLAAARADYARLTAVLYQDARYAGTVRVRLNGREASGLSALNLPRRIDKVEVQVRAGPQFVFSRAEVRPLPEGAALPEGFRPGAGALTPVMRRAVASAVTAWREAGHAKAEPGAQSIVANHPARTIDARFRVVPGPLLRFGALRIDTPSAVRAARLRAIAALPEGAVYSPDGVARAATRLRRTGSFDSVAIAETDRPNPDGTLDFTLSVQDAKPRRIGFGAELSSTDGITLSGYWMHRNLTGSADRLRFETEFGGIGGDSGGIDYTVGVTYAYPAVIGRNNTLNAAAYLERLDEPTYTSDVARTNVGLEHVRSERLSWWSDLGLRRSRTEDVFGIRDFNHVTLVHGLTWDTRDDEFAPSGGLYADVSALSFFGFSGSASGVQLKADLRGYRALGASERTVVALRGQMGLVSGAQISETPPELLFFSGGGGTVRGQEYQSLGVPRGNTLVGGRGFLALSAEVRQRLGSNLGLVGFVDYGYVSAEPDFSGTGESHSGIGMGARYFTSIGPIRVDLAVPLHNKTSNFFGLYIGIGHAF